MDRKAIEAARIEFDRASQSIDDLASSNSYADVERHWSAFLTSAGRIYSKLEQGSKKHGNSSAWWGRKLGERRADPLLRYLWHSRNADEHTIEAVTLQHPGTINEVVPTIAETENFHRQMKSQPLPYAALGVFEIVNPHVQLVDVIDCGVKYAVPHEHLGQQISAPHPNNIGLLALAYLSEMLSHAENLGTE